MMPRHRASSPPEALEHDAAGARNFEGYRLRFISNIDPVDPKRALEGLDAEVGSLFLDRLSFFLLPFLIVVLDCLSVFSRRARRRGHFLSFLMCWRDSRLALMSDVCGAAFPRRKKGGVDVCLVSVS